MKSWSAYLILFVLLGSCASLDSEGPRDNLECSSANSPEIFWESREFSNPESVVYDPESKSYFVSNVAGAPLAKDGKGWISQVSASGKMLKAQWFSGLHAPKGMRVFKGILWVADIDTLLGFEVATRKKLHSHKFPKAKFLNDVAVMEDGRVLVSDMLANRVYVYSLEEKSADVFIEGPSIESPNGLLVRGNSLYISAWGNNIQPDFSTPRRGRVLSVDLKTKEVSPITEEAHGNLDGLEFDSETHNFYVSDWMAGTVMALSPVGECKTLLSGFKGSADLGWDAEARVLLVPVMNENRVVAYKIP